MKKLILVFTIALYFFQIHPIYSQYCDSKSDKPWDIYIFQVGIGSNYNFSHEYKVIDTIGYSNYRDTIFDLDINFAPYIDFYLSFKDWNKADETYLRAWVDFDNNGVYEKNEIVIENKGNHGDLISTQQIKNTLGIRNMRIAAKYGSYPEPCEKFATGEVEDYTINFVGAINKHSDFVGYINTYNNTYNINDPQRFDLVIKNIGDFKGFYNYDLYYSEDTIIDYSKDLHLLNGRYNTMEFGDSLVLSSALTIPFDYPKSSANLIIIIEGDINEINISNNNSFNKITIELQPLPLCISKFWKGKYICNQINNNGNTELYVLENKNLFKKTIDINANILSSIDLGKYAIDSLLVVNNKLVKKLANGTIIYSKNLDSKIFAKLSKIESVVELSDGTYMFCSGLNYDDPGGSRNRDRDSVAYVYVDKNGIFLNVEYSYTSVGYGYNFSSKLLFPLSNNKFVHLMNIVDMNKINETNGYSLDLFEKVGNQIKFVKNLIWGADLENFCQTNICGNYLHFNYKKSGSNKFSNQNEYLDVIYSLDSLTELSLRNKGSFSGGPFQPAFYWNKFENFLNLPNKVTANISNLLNIKLKSINKTVNKNVANVSYKGIIQTSDTTCLIYGIRNDSLWVANPDCINPLAYKPDFRVTTIPILNNTKKYKNLNKLNLNYNISNIGNKNISTTHTVGVYLSNIVTKTKTLIKEIYFNNILFDSLQYSFSDSFIIPSNTIIGKYQLTIKVDNKNEVDEFSEFNNEHTNSTEFDIIGLTPQKLPKQPKKVALKSNTPIYSFTYKPDAQEAIIYPNPTKDILNIDLKDWDNQAIELKIYNTLGILTKQVILDENHDNMQQLDIATLQNGNYYMFVESGEERSSALKFVKVE
jgi:hypothetical protein